MVKWFFQLDNFQNSSKIYLFFFSLILISSAIFSRFRFEFRRSFHDHHPSKRAIVRYNGQDDILYSATIRVFFTVSWRAASIIEGWKVGVARPRKSVGPIQPPQPISSTLAPVPLFKTTFALFRPFRTATRSALIPSASAFCIRARTYIYIYNVYLYIYTATACALLLRILAHRDVEHTEQWKGWLKLDVLVIRRHSYTGRSCNRRPGRLLQATIRICLHNQDNNGNSERRAGDYFG